MKAKLFLLTVVTSLFTAFSCSAQQKITVEAVNSDISYNLDLQAVANLFGESYDLEDFEMRLNDPNNPISNLDLNNDGYVDYLRVIEATEKNTKLVVVQAVLDRDVYQDVASIVMEHRNNRPTYVQVIGNSYIYGPNYYFEPIYVVVPPIYSWFWSPRWQVWHSPYYWGYYPSYYRYYSTCPVRVYVNHCHSYYYRENVTYNYTTSVRDSRRVEQISRNVNRNDYATRYPDRSFASRNSGTQALNRSQLRDIQPDRVATTREGTRENTRESSVSGRGNAVNTRETGTRETTTRRDAAASAERTRETSLENGRTNAVTTREAAVGTNGTQATREIPASSLENSNSLRRTATEGVSTQRRVSTNWQSQSGSSTTRATTSVGSENAMTRPNNRPATSGNSTGSVSRSSSTTSSNSGSTYTRPSTSASSSNSSGTYSRPSSSSSSSVSRSSSPSSSSSSVSRSSTGSSSSSGSSRSGGSRR